MILRRTSRLTAIALLLAWPLSACTSWQPLPSPEPFARNTDHVQVLTPSGNKVVVWYPQVVGDSLRGARYQYQIGRTDFRLGAIHSLKIRRFSVGRTALLAGTIVAGVPVIVWLGFRIAASSGTGSHGGGLF